MGGEDTLKLYVRLPFRIEDELVVRALHPNIACVHLPRQKSRRWCIVDFESKEKLVEARKALKALKIEEKPVKVSPYRRGKSKKPKKARAVNSTEPLINLLEKDP